MTILCSVAGFLLLIQSVALPADAVFDAKYLYGLADQRGKALRRSQPSESDHGPDIFAKREEYFVTLKAMIQGIRSQYYFHDEFPQDLCAGLEKHALVLTGIEYPLSRTTGATGYDHILYNIETQLAEEMICRMSRAVFDSVYWDKVRNRPSGRAERLYRTWFKRWNTAKLEKR